MATAGTGNRYGAVRSMISGREGMESTVQEGWYGCQQDQFLPAL